MLSRTLVLATLKISEKSIVMYSYNFTTIFASYTPLERLYSGLSNIGVTFQLHRYLSSNVT